MFCAFKGYSKEVKQTLKLTGFELNDGLTDKRTEMHRLAKKRREKKT